MTLEIYAYIGGKWTKQEGSWKVVRIRTGSAPMRAYVKGRNRIVSEFRVVNGKMVEERVERNQARF